MRALIDRRLILVLLTLTWIELSLLPLLTVGGIKPNFFYVFLVFYAFRINWKRLVALSLMVGLIQDFMTNSFFGLETASVVGAAILLRFLAMRFDREKAWIQLASLFCFTWVALTFFSVLSLLVGERFLLDPKSLTQCALISVYTTGIGAVLFPWFEKWLKPALRQRQYELF